MPRIRGFGEECTIAPYTDCNASEDRGVGDVRHVSSFIAASHSSEAKLALVSAKRQNDVDTRRRQ